jgi:hypothetical protein
MQYTAPQCKCNAKCNATQRESEVSPPPAGLGWWALTPSLSVVGALDRAESVIRDIKDTFILLAPAGCPGL